ncbi:diphthine methyl ester synthase isoform X2 [Phycodurus eques]|uniref:diphthine methyl ester synthase isoform X2 n=1 Tax=Phycodurus eques TaxID=693459 RepID=UPI002ACD40D5|nr:diphthine methyl ester synthase isoform X2 [Phycodurus eques]
MLYLVGLGLGDALDITVKGLQVVRKCSRVYLEAYTSMLTVGKDALEEFYGKEVVLADRELVEQEAERILEHAKDADVAFLVAGDPFGGLFVGSATTHSDLALRAVRAGIPYQVVHNASVITAVGCCGLQLYNFGETVSLVYWTDSWRPESFYDKILQNRAAGLHTLCLLDIKVKEQSLENLMRGKKVYEPPRFMSAAQAADQLLQIVRRRRNQGEEPAKHTRPVRRSDGGHAVRGRGQTGGRRPEDRHGDVGSNDLVRPRRASPLAGRHRQAPPPGGGHVAAARAR